MGEQASCRRTSINLQHLKGLIQEETFKPKQRWSWWRLCYQLRIGKPATQVLSRLRLAQWLQHVGARGLARWLFNGLALRFGVYVGPRTTIGEGLHFPHPISVVIGDRLVLGERCRLYQQVTLAGAPKGQAPFPRLGNDVVVYPGAKVVGKGRVGNNVIIGANALVNQPFGDDVVLAGVPARVINTMR
ncbi:serine O-acetyltransferase [Halomonas saccharevitans]|uniref:serine O-acetyltransferase n=1 Tax=Halomonas saccharevitans TaxID=416872 RepID=UPI0015874FEA|nr:hypothetical protein [Halomonas saccharevitans]